jgi:hypothetical protein
VVASNKNLSSSLQGFLSTLAEKLGARNSADLLQRYVFFLKGSWLLLRYMAADSSLFSIISTACICVANEPKDEPKSNQPPAVDAQPSQPSQPSQQPVDVTCR